MNAARRAAMLWLLFGCGQAVWAQTSVTVQLRWHHAFQFAGYYAAVEKGYYEEAGLAVQLKDARPGLDVVDEVVSGRADFGVGNSGLLIDRLAGKPVVVVATIFQHSPLVLLARREQAVPSVHDLIGKRVMLEPGADELLAYLRKERIPVERLKFVEHTYNPQSLINGEVDAISAYSSNEPYFLEAAGIDYQVYTPRSAGIDFYGDNLFTTEGLLRRSPETVQAFREASLRGWRYALDHPDEIARLIHSRYESKLPLEFFLFEAHQTIPLVRPDLVDVGYMSTGRWKHIAEVYAEIGMLPRGFDFKGFLYEPVRDDLNGLRTYLGAALGVIGLITLVAAYIHHINRRLHRSVAETRRAAERLEASEEKYRLLTETMKDVVWTLDTDTLRFIYVSPSVERLRGYTVDEALAMPFEATFLPRDADEMRALVRQRARSFLDNPDAQPRFYTDEVEQPRKDGSTVWIEVVTTYCRNPRTGKVELHGVSRDISERRASQARIAYMAEHDMLTDLPNRTLVTDRLRQALAAARRNRHRVALLYIDLDRFKPVNDAYGHAVGDQLLREAAVRMRMCVRESDTVGRFGGDEFVVLLPHIDSGHDAELVAEKIRVALAESFQIDGLRLDVSSSIGIAVYPEHGTDDVSLLLHADGAMYAAKHGGRNRVAVFGAD
ncbi:diguanylate cyclase [uncultured Zoogloea sp.]|uniref:diguanylate cyclase domain-containing protein n=1 Tax=uncultured Zoogloea sp. TaxID=160237 RepID=UPI002629EFC3|nr:diguanylate cyclase [uncultured Zoogloea sp.]